jgi:hypothetical protein
MQENSVKLRLSISGEDGDKIVGEIYTELRTTIRKALAYNRAVRKSQQVAVKLKLSMLSIC